MSEEAKKKTKLRVLTPAQEEKLEKRSKRVLRGMQASCVIAIVIVIAFIITGVCIMNMDEITDAAAIGLILLCVLTIASVVLLAVFIVMGLVLSLMLRRARDAKAAQLVASIQAGEAAQAAKEQERKNGQGSGSGQNRNSGSGKGQGSGKK